MKKNAFAAVGLGLLVAACASTPKEPGDLVADPFENLNRQVFAFNTGADRYVIGPAAGVYETATPRLFRAGVGNFLGNLGEPVTFANTVLQAKPLAALDTALRFTINSTVGIGGIFDVADEFGVEKRREDFGQTLAVWGVDSGPYLVLPLLGPSTVRDTFGGVVDRGFDPLNQMRWQADYLGNDEDFDSAFRGTTTVLGILNARVAFGEQLETLQSQPEPYVALRRAYIGQREAAIRDGRQQPGTDPYADLPDFDAYESDDGADGQAAEQ